MENIDIMIKKLNGLYIRQRLDVSIYAVNLCLEDMEDAGLKSEIKKIMKTVIKKTSYGDFHHACAAVGIYLAALRCTYSTNANFLKAPSGSDAQIIAICCNNTIEHIVKNIGFHCEINEKIVELEEQNKKEMLS